MTLDQLNVALKNICDNRAQIGVNIVQIQEQQKSIPLQLQVALEKQTKLAGEMDAAIAALQVVITDQDLIKQTEAQVVVNAGSPPAAAGGSPAACQQSATGTETPGDSGRAGLADQPTSSASNSSAATNATSLHEKAAA
jgi:hypothetical protein